MYSEYFFSEVAKNMGFTRYMPRGISNASNTNIMFVTHLVHWDLLVLTDIKYALHHHIALYIRVWAAVIYKHLHGDTKKVIL